MPLSGAADVDETKAQQENLLGTAIALPVASAQKKFPSGFAEHLLCPHPRILVGLCSSKVLTASSQSQIK